jgi:hypothetical protein
VKVTRIDPSSGKNIETVVNCTDAAPAPEVFLRNGDVIEIPEKP